MFKKSSEKIVQRSTPNHEYLKAKNVLKVSKLKKLAEN